MVAAKVIMSILTCGAVAFGTRMSFSPPGLERAREAIAVTLERFEEAEDRLDKLETATQRLTEVREKLGEAVQIRARIRERVQAARAYDRISPVPPPVDLAESVTARVNALETAIQARRDTLAERKEQLPAPPECNPVLHRIRARIAQHLTLPGD